MIKINLLPYREERERLATLGYLILLASLTVATIMVISIIWVRQNQLISYLESKKNTLQNNLKIFAKIRKEAKRYEKDIKTLQNKIEAITTLRKGRSSPVRILDELSRRLADDVWLDSLVQQDSQFVIKGFSLTNEGIATFMKNLSQSDFFRGVELVQSVMTTMKGEKIYNFTLIVKYGETEETAKR